jgi:hypothetical protein
VDPDTGVENIWTLILTHLVENSKQIDNGNDSQIDVAVTSDEKFYISKRFRWPTDKYNT